MEKEQEIREKAHLGIACGKRWKWRHPAPQGAALNPRA
jgi:hypothetical protein